MADEIGQNQETRQDSIAGGDGGGRPRAQERSRTRRWLLLAMVPVAAAVVASAVVLPRAAAWGGWHGGFHGIGGHGHGDLTRPEERERLQRRLTFVLEQLDADEQQQQAIRAIVDRSLDEMVALHERAHVLRERFGAALLGEQVDRGELEQARQQLRELTDQGSRLAVERLAEISEVLSPEQRSRIYDFIEAVHQ